jgi:hypothetical protein
MVVVLLVATGVLHAVDAQTVHGRVIDTTTGVPLGGATLLLLNASSGDLGITTRADSAGQYRFRVPRAGSYHVKATYVGYEPAISAALDVANNGDVAADFVLRQIAPQLPTVTTTSSPNAGGQQFLYRQSRGLGHIITSSEIEEKGFTEVLDVFRDIPAALVSKRAGALLPTILLRGGQGSCEPTYFLNGSRFGSTSSLASEYPADAPPGRPQTAPRNSSLKNANPGAKEIIFNLPIDQVKAVEVYSGASELPDIYSGSESACGAIAVWTISPP